MDRDAFFNALLKAGIVLIGVAVLIAFLLGVIYVAENSLQPLIAIPLFLGLVFVLISMFYFTYR